MSLQDASQWQVLRPLPHTLRELCWHLCPPWKAIPAAVKCITSPIVHGYPSSHLPKCFYSSVWRDYSHSYFPLCTFSVLFTTSVMKMCFFFFKYKNFLFKFQKHSLQLELQFCYLIFSSILSIGAYQKEWKKMWDFCIQHAMDGWI